MSVVEGKAAMTRTGVMSLVTKADIKKSSALATYLDSAHMRSVARHIQNSLVLGGRVIALGIMAG
jgi:hypothetical protein